MCLIGLALDVHPRFAVVIATNRDEFFDRPAAALDWWQADAAGPWLVGGRDLSAGGTWMALADNGRIGALTNVRDPSRYRRGATSRGALVTDWLGGGDARPRARHTNPFNLLGGDLQRNAWWWASDVTSAPRPLARGVHGLSNAALDTPWPKVRRLKQALYEAVHDADDGAALTTRLLATLSDRSIAADSELPDTGIGLERERGLSPAFIALPEARYGTRCSTVLLGERFGARWRVSITERSFDERGQATIERSVTLDPWPALGERPALREFRFS